MGIPAYFRWISERYPKMMKDCVEFVNYDPTSGTELRLDASKANPNGLEFDNLYLDMNGIIHPCTHPEDGPAPTTEEEMFAAVCAYIDRVFSIVRPRKLLYMAIDGVAPRAKINQQRSRRFRSAREAEQSRKEKTDLVEEWRKLGFKVKEKDPNEKPPFDSNVITPGTPFMARLAIALRKYTADRIANDPSWKNIRILFSDSSVPGEGEHKIAEFIRVERAQPGYDANIHHVMYGLDADLIMLALSTHEVRFSILREEVFPKRGHMQNGKGVGPGGSAAGNSHKPYSYHQEYVSPEDQLPAHFLDMMQKDGLKLRADVGNKKPFHFLHVNVLREYLDAEFRDDINYEIRTTPDVEVEYNLERVIDDFVFLCFFVGNDFLPHLPTLDIREGAVDFLIELYKQQLPKIGYLTSDGGNVDFAKARKMLVPIGLREDEIFKERSAKEIQLRERQERDRANAKAAAQARVGQLKIDPGSMAKAMANLTPADKAAAGSPPVIDKRGRTVKPSVPPQVSLVALTGNRQTKVGSGEKNAKAEAALRAILGKRNSPNKSKRKLPDDQPPTPTINAAPGAAAKSKKPRVQNVQPTSPAIPVASPVSSSVDTPQTAPAPGGTGIQIEKPMVEKTQSELKEALHQRMREKNVIKNPHDNVKLGQEGWKERYYSTKFHWEAAETSPKKDLVRAYFEGLYWVMKYYYSGCVSWGWYYPYHYAPFASDLVESDVLTKDICFEIGEPFKPFSQLQAVMPASSGKLVLPTCYSDLMTNPKSPILDYYPEDFKLDLNGKRFEWQGVALLPFIDEGRLNDAIKDMDQFLTDEEKQRNSFGEPHIVLSVASELGKLICSLSQGMKTPISGNLAEGQFFGSVSSKVEGSTSSVAFSVFKLPGFSPHSSRLLDTAQNLPTVLNDAHRSQFRFGGWKQARFGILGRAAREIMEERYRKINGRAPPGSYGGGRGGRDHHRRSGGYSHHQRGERGSGGGGRGRHMNNSNNYHNKNNNNNNNRNYNNAASAMFGGLNTNQQQTWGNRNNGNGNRQPYHAQQSASGYYNPQHQQYQPEQAMGNYAQQQQAYNTGGYARGYGGGGYQAPPNQHQHQQQAPPYNYYQNNNNTNANVNTQQPQWSANPAAYMRTRHGQQNSNQYYQQPQQQQQQGGGLSGPTAASFRQAHGRGRGGYRGGGNGRRR